MREDMFKVIVERPRWGHSARSEKIRHLKEDDGRMRLSGKRMASERSWTKTLNENLTPLKRYLFKQRGRKWDDVFSEICARLDTGSTVKMHVREHLEDFVMIKVRVDENGNYLSASGWRSPRPSDQWWPALYVCPHDGRLKETRDLLRKLGLKKRKYTSWREKLAETSEHFVKLGDAHFLISLNGCWFDVKTNQPPLKGFYSEVELFEIIKAGPTGRDQDWKILSKKQLSKKELKLHGLKNGGANV